MNKLISLITYLLRRPTYVFAFIIGISIFSLGSAYTAQYVFGLAPCPLCLYQRVPFMIGIALGIAGLLLRNKQGFSVPILGLGALAFLSNAGIAFYHSGVERHWWKSFLEGCSVPDLGDDPASMMAAIMSAPIVRCDKIPWADPIFGLSMANYNVALCFGIFIICALSIALYKSAQTQKA